MIKTLRIVQLYSTHFKDKSPVDSRVTELKNARQTREYACRKTDLVKQYVCLRVLLVGKHTQLDED